MVDADNIAGVVILFASDFDKRRFARIVEIAGENAWAADEKDAGGGRRKWLQCC